VRLWTRDSSGDPPALVRRSALTVEFGDRIDPENKN